MKKPQAVEICFLGQFLYQYKRAVEESPHKHVQMGSTALVPANRAVEGWLSSINLWWPDEGDPAQEAVVAEQPRQSPSQ